VAPTLDGLSLAGIVGIDMPLGLLADGWRDADALARRALGRRGVTVFAIPPRPVWEQPTYAAANRACRELTGKGLSAQTWGLRGKLLEADAFRRTSPARLFEVHPELAFAALAGAPLRESKHTTAGLAVRRQLLARVGLTLPATVAGAP
jgi:predicted RNase H-like nuclease